jgi:hypothetical protein
MMKRFFFMVCIVVVAGLGLAACDGLAAAEPGASPAPTATVVPVVATVEKPATPTAEALPSPTAEPAASPTELSVPGSAVSFDRLSLVVPTGVANSGSGTLVAEVAGDNAVPWDIAPAHIQLKLEGFALQDKFHQPQIYVYPAEAYAQAYQGAAQSLERLRGVLSSNSGAPLTNDELPLVPFFNATQIFASHVAVVPFKNGQGVRVVTQYAQGLVPVNNHELIYHFEGLTSDGKYYVIAVLPVTAPGLAEDASLNATVPARGVPLPDFNSANPDMRGYYGQVLQMLDGLQPGAFTPNLDQLDALIGSLSIATDN